MALAADRAEYEDRIVNPDWPFYEEHLGRTVPASLVELFNNRSLLLAEGELTIGEHAISTFGALDERGLDETRPWVGFDAVAIAKTVFGDPIYLRPGADRPDEVYISYHDGGDTELVAPDVARLVRKIKIDADDA